MDTHIEFKRKIDNARNILVGAVPSPAGQIDQITYALIYKFMSDIDDKTARLPNGVRQYFVGEYEKYDWHNLMRLDGQDKLNRYRDALSKMNENPHLPEIFRSIYQNAFLPYNDPRTLNLFLKEIDGFVHSKSDAIGDAYEYLLSITGAQGDVGQFRTPRHIIKFIVDVVQPGKSDTVLDPACGTAGFLIAAYNYVRMQHDGMDDEGNQNGEQRLTADERKKLHGNYYGYDIDPTMVRTATVNMYLHGFSTPNIEIHDTLTSDEHWNQRYDVILANPPFMTPKGGIQPHGKFGVKANRAEVLFVDYIASHLKPNGRAGIIVPEGIIFQSGTAYKELRKNLVENNLYAVVSLPSGVFNPYAGVKTSILLLDKELAAKKDEILFVKIENDGHSLGAQRKKILGDQFPEALNVIQRFRNGEELQTEFAHAVPRKQISQSGDYNLSGDRYKIAEQLSQTDWPEIRLGDLASIDNGNAFKSSEYVGSGARVIRITNVQTGRIVDDSPKFIDVSRMAEFSKYELHANDLLMSLTGNVGRVGLIGNDMLPALLNQRVARIRPDETKILKDYLFRVLNTKRFERAAINSSSGIAQKNLSTEWLKTYEIPLPPIEIQREIVAELDGYQKIIDAAGAIVKTYKPTIKISPKWEKVSLPDAVFLQEGPGIRSYEYDDADDAYPIINVRCVKDGYIDTSDGKKVKRELAEGQWKHFQIVENDILYTISGTIGRSAMVRAEDLPLLMNTSVIRFKTIDSKSLNNKYLYYYLGTPEFIEKLKSMSTGMAQLNVGPSHIKTMSIPLPSIETQRKIVAELEAEQKLIDANKKLIEIYQKKIKSKISEIWGE